MLSQTNNPDNVLRQVARQIEKISDNREQSNVAGSTAILAGLVLKKDFIKSVLRQEIMRESVIYQEIEAEAIEKGVQQGLQRGLQQEAVSFTLRLLKKRLGEVKTELTTYIQELGVEQLEELGEALLDFKSESELVSWLQERDSQ